MADILTPRPTSDEVPRRSPWSCRCGRRWSSLTQAHCPTCHEHFGTVGLFDKHRHDDVCFPPESVVTKRGQHVFRASEETDGIVWRTFARREFPQADA